MKGFRVLLWVPLVLLLVGCSSGTASQSPLSATPDPIDTPTPSIGPTPTIPNVPARLVHFTTSDNVRLAGLLYGHGKTMVICSHMSHTDKDIWSATGIPQRLAVLGYQVLAYDFRGNGDSAGPSDIWSLDVDLRAAVNFAHQQGATKIVLMGASMGGTTSLKVASEEQVAAVISISGPQTFSFSVSDAEIKAIQAPKLFMDSENDGSFITDTQHMYDIARPPKEIYIYPGGAHGTDIFGGDNGDAPAQRVLHYIEQYAPAS